ncbi:MAG: outer membrane protein assembly factor [Rhodospirillales bacterium 20-60-12]|nr:MAG: outer membrane protein assembly factor [Rhodospirillales bacterium 20-60-12]HQT66227.1 BamA/TamA family outer membrane protein [Acetobacteraceae bacterium]
MRARGVYIIAASMLLAGMALAAKTPSYQVAFKPSGDPALDTLLKQTSSLVSLQTKLPAGNFALIGRANADAKQFSTVLESLGYDSGQVDITIDGQALDSPTLLQTLRAAPRDATRMIVITPHPGMVYHLGALSVPGAPAGSVAKLGIKPGDIARAAPVLAARDALQNALQNEGYAFAHVAAPIAYADPKTHLLDVTYDVTPGARVDVGAIHFAGLQRTDPAFLRRHILLCTGEPYSNTELSTARDSLLSLGVFSSVTAIPASHAAPPGQVPITFQVTEQKLHAVTLGAAYSTDQGITLDTSWLDRNLFGRAEQLTITAAATGLGGTGTTSPGYDLKALFQKPDFWVRQQTLSLSAEAVREFLTAYSRSAVLLNAGLSRPLGKHILASYGVGFVGEQVDQEGITRNYALVQLPLGFAFDNTNSTFNPTRGFKANINITPSLPASGGSGIFTIIQASGSTYVNLEQPGRGVLALRGLIGSIEGATQFQVPPDQRFYAGGTGTVRGFTYQTVGPLFPDSIPQGGTSIDAGSIEFRQRIGKSFGIVPFLDAGQVAATNTPFSGKLREGAGLGLRYYTGIGPIRLDVAVPVNRPPGGAALAVYIGLGQAF